MKRRLYADEAADLVGVKTNTWRAYCSPRDGKPPYGPPPDGYDIERGHARPWWRRSTVTKWMAKRPRKG